MLWAGGSLLRVSETGNESQGTQRHHSFWAVPTCSWRGHILALGADKPCMAAGLWALMRDGAPSSEEWAICGWLFCFHLALGHSEPLRKPFAKMSLVLACMILRSCPFPRKYKLLYFFTSFSPTQLKRSLSLGTWHSLLTRFRLWKPIHKESFPFEHIFPLRQVTTELNSNFNRQIDGGKIIYYYSINLWI